MLGRADKAGDSTEFVEFILRMIRDALKEVNENQNLDVVVNVAINVVTNEVVSGMQPGDDITFTITLKNSHSDTTD